MFVRKKKSRRGQTVYQLVENARVDGKVRQRVIAHLGESASLAAAIQEGEARLERARMSLAESLARAEEIRAEWNSTGSTVPDDLKIIRRWARHNWDMKFFRNALMSVQWAQKRMPLLESHLARLRAAEGNWRKKSEA